MSPMLLSAFVLLLACDDEEHPSAPGPTTAQLDAVSARLAALESTVADQAGQIEAQAQTIAALEAQLADASAATDDRLAALEASVATLGGGGSGGAVESWDASGTIGAYVTYGSDMVPIEVEGAALRFTPSADGRVLVHSTLTSYSTAPSTGYFPCQGTVRVRLTDATGAYQESDPQRMYAALAVDAAVFDVVAGEAYTLAWFYTVTEWSGSYACTYQHYEHEAIAFAAG